MTISPELFNRIRFAALRYGEAREALGGATVVAHTNPTKANLEAVALAESAVERSLKGFQLTLGSVDRTSGV